jgi:hypothetical protein
MILFPTGFAATILILMRVKRIPVHQESPVAHSLDRQL